MISQRRTKEEWELLLAMHRGYYPLVDFQAFRRGGPPPPTAARTDGRPPDNRIRWRRRSHICDGVSADDTGVVGVVGDDATAAARGQVGAVRARNWAGAFYGTRRP